MGCSSILDDFWLLAFRFVEEEENNCLPKCAFFYYYTKYGQYKCTKGSECPGEYPYFILDKKSLYHSGTSINYAGSKTFSINKITDKNVLINLLNDLKGKLN